MKKLLTFIILFTFLAAQVPAGAASGVQTDSAAALQQFDGLSSAHREKLLQHLWDCVVEKIGKIQEIAAEDVYTNIKTNLTEDGLWNDIVEETGSNPAPGKISKDSVMILVQKILAIRETIADFYSMYNKVVENELVGEFLEIPEDGTPGQVFTTLMPYTVPLLTLNSNGWFTRNGDVSKAMADKFKMKQDIFVALFGDINKKADGIAGKINKDIKSGKATVQDAICALRIFNLYSDPDYVDGGVDSSIEFPLSLDSIASSIFETGEKFKTANNFDDREKLAKEVVSGINAVAGIIAETEQTADILRQGLLIINAVSSISDSNISSQSFSNLYKALYDLANRMMDRIGEQEFKVVVNAGAITFHMDQGIMAEAAGRFDSVIGSAYSINAAFEKSNMDIHVGALLKIKLLPDLKAGEAAVDRLVVELPSGLLTTALNKGLTTIVVDAPMAAVTLTPDAIPVNVGSIATLVVEHLNADGLPDNVKNAVKNNAVYSISLQANEKAVSSFKKFVEVSLPFTLKQGNSGKTSAFFINAKDKLQNMGGSYDSITKTVRFTTKNTGRFFTKMNGITFKDMNVAAWSKDYVEEMAAKGIINGVGKGMFNPGASVSRAEFLKMVLETMKLVDLSAKNEFSDVKPDDWFYRYVSSAVKTGIASGKADGTFMPDEKITREEMAVIIGKALEKAGGKALPEAMDKYLQSFKDNNTLSPASRGYIALVCKYAIMNGRPEGTFAPGDFCTRAEAAAVIYRLFYLH